MISLPALPATNTEKPVKSAGLAGLDSAFASILEGEAGTAKQPGGKILPVGGKDLPDAVPPEALALQVARKALHGHAKPDPKVESETAEPAADMPETTDDSETSDAAPKGAEIVEAIVLAIETPIKLAVAPPVETPPAQAPTAEPESGTPKQATVRAPQFKAPMLQMALAPAAAAPETAAPAVDTKPSRHAPLHAAQAFLAALRQPGETSVKPRAEQPAVPEQAIAAAVAEAAPAAVQEVTRPAKAARPQPQREVTVELGANTKPAIVSKDPLTRSALSTVLPLAPASQPAIADNPSPAPAVKPSADLANVQAAVRPHEFATLVDRLVEAREAARPANAGLTVMHADFGQVSMRFGHDNGNLTVSLASNDPGFVPAVTAAAATADALANSDAGAQGSRRDDGGHAARTTGDNTNSTGGERGTGREGAERWQGREGRIRQQPHFAAHNGAKPHDGIFA